MHLSLRIVLALALSLLVVGMTACGPTERGDDDSASDDDDAGPGSSAEWATLGEAHATFTGGGRDLGAVMEAGHDFDGDGVPDLVLAAHRDLEEGSAGSRGEVYIFFGTTVAAGGLFNVELDADVVIRGDAAGYALGTVLAAGGDLDQDGRNDLAIASAVRDRVYIFFGSSLSSGTELLASDADVFVLHQVVECMRFVGDLDAAGGDDLLVSNTLNSAAGANLRGQSFLMTAATLLGDHTDGSPSAVLDAHWDFPGSGAGEASGCQSGSAGDMDGDGWADLLIGAQGSGPSGPNSGKFSLFSGAWLGVREPGEVPLADSDFVFGGEFQDDRMGSDLAHLGDLDGDGHSEVLLSARQNDESAANAGQSYLVSGARLSSASGLLDATALRLTGESEGDASGSAVAALGDVDGDGLPDFAIAAPGYDGAGSDSGAVYIVRGGTLDLSGGSVGLGSAATRISGLGAGHRLGSGLEGAGDVDSDGFADLLIGAPGSGTAAADGATPGSVWLLLSPFGD